ncbi:hypothetical protein [Ectopseudomonas alcaliphila]|uniref:hypothetical protein n=1 Tax=Ectopseudomonas alcaliphila TaxID=101564 RepID=UPI0027887ABE|nr:MULTISPECIES: hypothetical protein [Pseudomonas]MDP9939010.1 hypothetical protein [Pseudomonas sp. 3400]MDR7011233.1 hypothetical protein [Pseudomonas alcaliphila]
MRTFLRTAFLPVCLLLAACGQEPQVKLRFDESIRQGAGIEGSYLESLQLLFQELGYRPGHLRYTLVDGDEQALMVRLQSEPLDPMQREALIERFTPIMQARERWPASLEITGIEDELPTPLRTSFTAHGRPFMVKQENLNALDRPSSLEEVFCRIEVKLNEQLPPLSFQRTRNWGDEDQPGSMGELSLDLENVHTPARLRFSDPELQKAVDERQVEVIIDNDDYLTSPIEKLVFEIGSMGRHVLLGRRTLLGDGYHERCADLAVEVGRPFNLFMGQGIDRLTSFELLDNEG